MYILISVCLIALFLFGVFVEYVSTMRERKSNDKNRKILKLQHVLARSQNLLNGRTILPLTVTSSIVCLERSHAAITGLIEIESTEKRIEALQETNKKLQNFKTLEPTLPFFYARQPMPTTPPEQSQLLKQSMMLVILLKVEHGKGRLSVEELNGEVTQLEILITRLKSALYSAQAMEQFELKDYPKAQALSDKAMELLQKVLCEDPEVIQLLDNEMANISLLNDGVSGVIEEKSHTFYDKFKGNEKVNEPPKKKSALFKDDNDGLDNVFGKKRKY